VAQQQGLHFYDALPWLMDGKGGAGSSAAEACSQELFASPMLLPKPLYLFFIVNVDVADATLVIKRELRSPCPRPLSPARSC
jgi:hypothetical protein